MQMNDDNGQLSESSRLNDTQKLILSIMEELVKIFDRMGIPY